jgi:hypothetical protein
MFVWNFRLELNPKKVLELWASYCGTFCINHLVCKWGEDNNPKDDINLIANKIVAA